MKVQLIPINDIKLGERAREDYGDIEALAASIQAKGVLQPIIVGRSSVQEKHGQYKLLAGGRRIKAAITAGLDKIPAVLVREGSNGIDELEIELIENIARKDFTWAERAKLEAKIYTLKREADPKWTKKKQADTLQQSEGSTRRRLRLADMLETIPELAKCGTEDQAWKKFHRLQEDIAIHTMGVETPAEILSAAKWARDHYKIGEFLDKSASLKAGIAEFAEVDPPYGIEIDRRKKRGKDHDKINKYNEVPSGNYPDLLREWASEVYRLLENHSFCIWWFGMTWYSEVLSALRKAKFTVGDIPAVWVKGQIGQTASPDTMLGSAYEPFFVARKGQPVLRRAGRPNVFTYTPVPPSQKIHATEKPIALMEDILETFCLPGARIVVPFLGSGVTLRAAYRQKMTGWGYDLDESIKRRFIASVQKDIPELDK